MKTDELQKVLDLIEAADGAGSIAEAWSFATDAAWEAGQLGVADAAGLIGGSYGETWPNCDRLLEAVTAADCQ